MTNIEQKALALVNECAGHDFVHPRDMKDKCWLLEALCRAIERHEQFAQEVSDAVESLCNTVLMSHGHRQLREMLSHRFIIAKPVDELYECIREALPGSMPDHHAKAITKNTREALAKRGGRIVFDGEKAGE